jgi:hypothetical protein
MLAFGHGVSRRIAGRSSPRGQGRPGEPCALALHSNILYRSGTMNDRPSLSLSRRGGPILASARVRLAGAAAVSTLLWAAFFWATA